MSGETENAQRREPTLSPVRLLVAAVLLGAAYLGLPWLMNGDASVSEWYPAAAAAAGAVVGGVAGAADARRGRGPRAARRGAVSVPAFIVSVTGAALLLGRVLDEGAVPWVLLVSIGLTTGLAANLWAKARVSAP